MFSRIKIAWLAISVVTALVTASHAHAFIGPNTSAGSGGGLFTIDASRNIGFGTASPTPLSTFNTTSTESGPSGFGYVFTIASTSNPGISLKNLTSGTGNTYIWSSRNFGNLQLYRESPTLPGYVVIDINPYGDVAIGQKATSTGGVARLFVGGNIQTTGSFIGTFSGNLSAANVTGPSAFGSGYGTYSYAFPGALAIGTSTTVGLPASGLWVTGNIGIGTSTPATALSVVGTSTVAGNVKITGTGYGIIFPDNSVQITAGGGSSFTTITVSATSTFNGNIQFGGQAVTNLNMNGNNITGVNKITVTTIDPLYRIGGVNYSTYAASIAGGVKEEYVGRGNLQPTTYKLSTKGNYEYVIDFSKVSGGSDLWVWRKAVDFSRDNVEVLATAYGTPVPISYEIDGNQIIFRTNLLMSDVNSIEFSYRLIGKRFDWRSWPTYSEDQKEPAGNYLKIEH